MIENVDLEGSLGFIGLADLLQLLGSNNNSGVLILKNQEVIDNGYVYIHNGNPVDARLGTESGIKVMFAFFGWLDGRFTFIQKKVDSENRLGQGRMQIILDALRMLDDGEIKQIESSGYQQKKIPDIMVEKTDLHVIKGPFVDYMYVIDEEIYDDGQEFAVQGSYGNWIWVVLDGVVEIIRKFENTEIPVLRLGQGTFIGNLSTFIHEKRARSASVVARGKVQLGIIDNQRLHADFSKLSPDFRDIITSLDRRLKLVTDTYISVLMSNYKPPHKDGIFTPVIKIGDRHTDAWKIETGEALVVKRDGRKGRLLCELGAGDFIGSLPFLDIEMEPSSAGVFVSSDFQKTELDVSMLESEYHSFSDTMKNMLSTLAKCIAVTANLTSTGSVKRREG